VKNLESRIEDWKGHHLSNFGDLLLDDVFLVTKSEVDREYHVFLFEKIILCCKEAFVPQPNGRQKVGKSNSLLKKQATPLPLSLLGGPGQPKKKSTPLLLKGRIFLNNVTQAVPTLPRHSTCESLLFSLIPDLTLLVASSNPSQHALSVYWRGDDDLEFFTLRCRSEEQLRQWENQINRLIKEAAMRRTSERGLSKVVSQVSNSTNPSHQHPSVVYNHEKSSSTSSYSHSVYMSTPTYGGLPNGRSGLNPYSSSDEQVQLASNPYPRTPHQAYPSAEGFDFELDDEFEDYPPSGSYPTSGRGTPMGARRGMSQSMPPERDAIPGYDRPRAHTEDTNGTVMAQWRTHSPMLPPPPPPMTGLPPPPNQRPMAPRSISNQSGASFTSEASFGPGVGGGSRPPSRAPLRSQFSSTKLSTVYNGPEGRSMTPQIAPNALPPINRSRSASQPTAYVPRAAPPPVPTATPWMNRPNGSTVESKRGSGSSQSTGDSSDYSPNSSSPITPFGSSESSLSAMGTLRTSHSQTSENVARANSNAQQAPAPVKVKVHFYEDIFVIQVPRTTHYNELVEKVGKKILLCGRRRDDGVLRLKYKDEDGDLVSLGSTEDVQMAFEQFGPGGQVSLFVT
jgi:cell division control protein 24